jgi:hypothetical protein
MSGRRFFRKLICLLKDAFKQAKMIAICATLRYVFDMAKSTAISIRFDPELRAELEKIAQRENRKLSNLVETVLREYVESQRRKRAPKDD